MDEIIKEYLYEAFKGGYIAGFRYGSSDPYDSDPTDEEIRAIFNNWLNDTNGQ